MPNLSRLSIEDTHPITLWSQAGEVGLRMASQLRNAIQFGPGADYSLNGAQRHSSVARVQQVRVKLSLRGSPDTYRTCRSLAS